MTTTLTCDNCEESEEICYDDQQAPQWGFRGVIADPCNPGETHSFDVCAKCTSLVMKALPALKKKLSETEVGKEYSFEG